MNKIIVLISFLFLTACSFNKGSSFWTEQKTIIEENKNISKVFKEKEVTEREFNPDLLITLPDTVQKNINKVNLQNNFGRINDLKSIEDRSNFKFSKIQEFEHFEPDLGIDKKGFSFFDSKGNIIKFDIHNEIIWKQNLYSKSEIKQKPKITLFSNENYLVAFDNISNFYALNSISGEVLWKKKNINPFNSEVKVFKDKIFFVDLNNIIRCISLEDGSEQWTFSGGNTLLKSHKRNSIVVKDDKVYFNNSLGDITALNINDGSLVWQKPTQSSRIIENAFSLVSSDLVINDNNLYFSNNRNEFFTLSLANGLIKWKQDINASIRPLVVDKFIFTVSDEGYLFVIEKNSGNIIRITNVFDVFGKGKLNYFKKNKDKILPVGMMMGYSDIFLTTDNGRLLLIDIKSGKTKSIIKLDNKKISKPFVFDNSLLVIKENSVVKLN